MDLEESMPPTEVAVYDNGCLLSHGPVSCSKAGSWSMTPRTTARNGCDLKGLPLTYWMQR